jgi:hypothetical protein
MNNILDVVLSTEVIAWVLIVASLAMAVRSILFFTRESTAIAPKLMKIESDLEKWRGGMGEKKQAVTELTTVVDPLREREGRLRMYYDSLKNMEVDHEKNAAKATEEQEQARKKRVQRKKRGFG